VGTDDIDLGTVDWTPTMYEHTIFRIGENNRLSDGYNLSDTCRMYGLWDYTPKSLTFTVGESDPKKDWYFAQIGSGTWTIKFNCDETYTDSAHLTISAAAMTSKPKLTVKLNGSQVDKQWSTDINDGAIYRSATQSGRHGLRTFSFPASKLKQGSNTIALTQSAGNHGGLMYDCIKLEAGAKVVSGIAEVAAGNVSRAKGYYYLNGIKASDDYNQLPAGIYISGGKKVLK